MPEIGNPNQPKNTFGNIKMAKRSSGSPVNPNKIRPQNVGKELNKMSGVSEDSGFVDKKDHNKLDKHAFLKLLSNQLKNQDPFKPVDQKKFAADLAQFSQLEQLANMNSKFDKVFDTNKGEDKYMGASFLGKVVETKGMSVNHTGTRSEINLPFYLDKPASKVMIRVFDKSNSMIAQIDKESMGKGGNSVVWDGYQLDDSVATKGEYRFEVNAWDDQFNKFKGETRHTGEVTGVSFENGETILMVDGSKKVFLRDVKSFSVNHGKHAAAKKSAHTATEKYNNIKDQTH